jgi:hypothetical protein
MSPQDLVRFLECRRFPLTMESELHAAIVGEFQAAGVAFEREVMLSHGDRVDIMVGGTVIELKVKGGRSAMYRQIERYCAHDIVTGVILASRLSINLPTLIKGKPAFVANLSRAWL